jgi:hypothetical protein
MRRDISEFISVEDSAKSLIGEIEQTDGKAKFSGHVIGCRQRNVALVPHEEHFETFLSRPALNSYIDGGVAKRSIMSFGVLSGFQIGRLYVKDTIRSVFLRPYKFVSLTIVCSDRPTVYSADQADRLHFAIGLGGQAFEKLAELVRLKQLCSARIPALIWRGPSLNFCSMEACDRDYSGLATISAYEEDALDFALNELIVASYGT